MPTQQSNSADRLKVCPIAIDVTCASIARALRDDLNGQA